MQNDSAIQLHHFRNGKEPAFTWMYGQVYTKLLRHGTFILQDRCALSSIIHEALLKTWQHRQRMQSLQHIYRFARLNVTWKCYAWYRDPINLFHYRRMYYAADITRVEESINTYFDELQPPSHFFDEERLHTILAVLPYLPPQRHTIMQLYFKHGISYKQIAKRYGTSVQGISTEVQQSLAFLKQVIGVQKRCKQPGMLQQKPGKQHQPGLPLSWRGTEGEVYNGQPSNNPHPTSNPSMEPEMETIFRYRYENKMSFATIAFKMNLSQQYVQQQYIAAHKKLRQLQHNKSP
jgi:RNA polymerase sigma factor (sigma-70 family)